MIHSAASHRSAHRHPPDAGALVREVEAASRARGLRLTPLRLGVLQLIARAGKPVKAYDLLDQLKASQSHAAPPTVYRALDFLLENGFIHRLESINAFVGCHHPSEAHQVPFLICDVCDGATELCDDGAVAGLIASQAGKIGFQARAQTLEVHGVCKACRRR